MSAALFAPKTGQTRCRQLVRIVDIAMTCSGRLPFADCCHDLDTRNDMGVPGLMKFELLLQMTAQWVKTDVPADAGQAPHICLTLL